MLARSMPFAPSVVASMAKPLADGYDELLEGIGDSEIVMIGEASHGTHDFYSLREALNRRRKNGSLGTQLTSRRRAGY